MHQSNILLDEYKNNISFKKTMDEAQMHYNQIIQLAFYSDKPQLIPNNFQQYSSQPNILFYYGYRQEIHPTKQKYVRMNFMTYLQQMVKKPYTIVYFNNLTSGSEYSQFRKMFLELTLEHFVNLRWIIVVRPKGWNLDYLTLNKLHQYVNWKTAQVSNCEQLCERLILDRNKFINFIPQKIYEIEKQYFDPSLKRNNQDKTMQIKQQSTKKSNKKSYKLEDYKVSQAGIPLRLEILIDYFQKHPQGILQQGIFRKSVSTDVENQFIHQLDSHNYQYIHTANNPHIIASTYTQYIVLIKRFFSTLTIPLVPFAQFQLLMSDQTVIDRNKHVKDIILKIPSFNLKILSYLLTFLKQKVLPKQKENKMSIHNLCVCIGPCLMWAETASLADLKYANKIINVMKIIIQDYEHIFGVKIDYFRIKSQIYVKKTKGIIFDPQQEPQRQQSNQNHQIIYPLIFESSDQNPYFSEQIQIKRFQQKQDQQKDKQQNIVQNLYQNIWSQKTYDSVLLLNNTQEINQEIKKDLNDQKFIDKD